MFYAGQMGVFGFFGMFLFWGLFIWLVVWLISKNNASGHEEKSPLQIAKERYARGELTGKQFEEMKDKFTS